MFRSWASEAAQFGLSLGLWWPTPRPEVAGNLLDEQQRAAAVEFDLQTAHNAGALKRLAQAEVCSPVERIPADVAEPLPPRGRRMVYPLAIYRPNDIAGVEHVVAAIGAVVRLARDAVLDRP